MIVFSRHSAQMCVCVCVIDRTQMVDFSKSVMLTHAEPQTVRHMSIGICAPCGLRGCKNRPAPFPGRMLYKATKPGSVCPVS